MKWASLGTLLLLAAPVPGVRVSRVTETSVSAAVTFATPTPIPPGSTFRGALVLDGAEPGLPVSAPMAVTERTATVPVEIELARVSPDLLAHLRLDSFDYVLSGTAGDSPVAVSGGGRWEELGRDAGVEGAVGRFLHLRSAAVEKVSLTETQARGELEIRNPFAFDLKVAGLEYRLIAKRRAIASGKGRGILLHRSAVSRVDLPLQVENFPLISAAGSALLSGGEIDGALEGSITLRLPAGDVKVPFAVPGKISIL